MKTEKKTELTSERLYSLDILRGFDMFWITGGAYLFAQLATSTNWAFFKAISHQLEHREWTGFAMWDLVFPLFMFIAGVAIPYALLAKREKGISKSVLYKKVTRRLILLVVLGYVYNGILRLDFENMRYASVLGQIGFAYFFHIPDRIKCKKNAIIGFMVCRYPCWLWDDSASYSCSWCWCRYSDP